MSRPTWLDLSQTEYSWREVPMPGANAPFALTRLASRDGAFVVHGRFPAGFVRDVPGGYVVAEEFLVLDGEVEIGGASYRRGDLTYIPAGNVRESMSTSSGCTVLAWFGGPAIFQPADELPGRVTSGVLSLPLLSAGDGDLLDLPGSRWTRGALVAPDAVGDVVEADLSAWRRLDPPGPLSPTSFVRVER